MAREYSAAQRFELYQIARKEFWERKAREARQDEMFGQKKMRCV